MSDDATWLVLVRKATESRSRLLSSNGTTNKRVHALRFTEQNAREVVADLQKRHASYFFKAKPWGRP